MTTPLQVKKVVKTPGGRAGSDSSIGSSSNGENWIEQEGGFPRYMRIVRNGLMKEGMVKGRAHALAVAAIKRWAKGGDNVSPKVQAAAAVALKQWEKMRASAHSKGLFGNNDYMHVSEAEFKAEFPATLLQELHDHIDSTTEQKDADMEMEFKTVGVNGLTVDDEAKGIVTTLVSVTGIVDNVKDVIHPGAYEKSLKTRNPKGVWSHSWDTPVSKTLDVKELQPGDPMLPKTMPNGAAWPRGAGALMVKTQFNLETQRGREAYSDVTFFGAEQEWSIGYQVPVGGARIDSKTGQRHIDYLELYEYSPVLFGAMSSARTMGPGVKSVLEFDSVRDAQTAYRQITMNEADFKAWADELGVEHKGFNFSSDDIEVKGMGGFCNCDDPDCKSKHNRPAIKAAEEDTESKTNRSGHTLRTRARRTGRGKEVASEDEEFDLFDDEEGKALGFEPTAYEYEALVNARDALDLAIKSADAAFASTGGQEEETKGLSDIVEKNLDTLGDFAEEMKDAAEAFDTAYDLDDVDGMNEFGSDFLELVEKALDAAEEADDAAMSAVLHKTAAAVASMAPVDEEDTETPEEDEDEDDTDVPEGKPKPLPKKPEKKDDEQIVTETKTLNVTELNDLRVALTPRRRR